MFQSTPLHKGRHYESVRDGRLDVFQSTPLHKGRPSIS